MTKLSILIPTLPETESINYLKRLRQIIDPQVARYAGEIEIYIHDAPRSMPTGTKRNQMIANTIGEYFCFIDCDDLVPMYYVNELMKAIEQKPDVITFKGHITTDGANNRDFVIKLGERYEERKGIYYRYPNHLCCFKRSVVSHVKFKEVWQQEDYQWATDIKNKNLLKSEIHIDANLYHYDFKTNKTSKTKPGVTSRVSRLR